MCRYAYKTSKPHLVCFRCRKQFKRPPVRDLLAHRGELEAHDKLQRAFHRAILRARLEAELGTTLDELRKRVRDLVTRCPQCGGPMADLGLDFKPPRANAVRAWRRIEGMHRLGHAWHTCGCNGPGFVPRDATGYAQYLARRERLFTTRLKAVLDDRALDAGARSIEATRLTELVAEIHRERERTAKEARG